ncbi:hypothetical protein LTR17_017132 [Elasticomyces elasticus]|nr:hypothetical protein LTR17_017132 [Elasticomyces elasticus]
MTACRLEGDMLMAPIPPTVIDTVITACNTQMWNERRGQTYQTQHAMLLARMIQVIPEGSRPPAYRSFLASAMQKLSFRTEQHSHQQVSQAPQCAPSQQQQQQQHLPSLKRKRSQQQLQRLPIPHQAPSTKAVKTYSPPETAEYEHPGIAHGLPIPSTIPVSTPFSAAPNQTQRTRASLQRVVDAPTAPRSHLGPGLAPPALLPAPVTRDGTQSSSAQVVVHRDNNDVEFVGTRPVNRSNSTTPSPSLALRPAAVVAATTVADPPSQQPLGLGIGVAGETVQSTLKDERRVEADGDRGYPMFTREENLRLLPLVQRRVVNTWELVRALPARSLDTIMAHLKTERWKLFLDECARARLAEIES